MIDVMENIKKLSAALDAETASLHPSGKLLLLGSQDSVFLKAIKRKADQLGINCDHSLNKYKAECRTILQLSKHIEFADEDTFDLTYKSYDELVAMFATQDALPEAMYLEAIENTNRMADSVEPFELDISFKYPILYGERDREVLHQVLDDNLQAKIKEGAITPEQIEPFKAAIAEECRVFDKIEMSGFMLFMSELVTWCKSHGIPIGFNRGSCGGSRVAYRLIVDHFERKGSEA